MCRSIKVLRRPGQPVTEDELSQAARQFVRKISGFHKPSRANQEAFERAIVDVAEASRRLLDEIAFGQRAREAPAADQGSAPVFRSQG